MLNVSSVCDVFRSANNVVFITIKGRKAMHWKIGWASDRMRKISENFFVVREDNKVHDGSHFHILASLKKAGIPSSWFKKGVHMHVKKVHDVSLKYKIPESADEEEFRKYGHGFRTMSRAKKNEKDIILKAIKKACKKIKDNKKDGVIGDYITYMMKENPIIQYVDYVFVKNAKQEVVPKGGESPSTP